jgi:glycyl-tRNA synthetase
MKLADRILDIAKRRGFFWPSFEIYQGCSGFYTYGPLGTLLKLHVESVIRNHYVNREGCLLVEAPTLTTEDPWVASGHVESFTDMIVDCGKCGEPYRADHIIEEKTKVDTEGMNMKQVGDLIKKHKIRCPKCGGLLGNIYDYNLMFRTFIGPGKNKVSGAMRPETAQTTYMPFKRLFEIGRKKLPLGVLQVGKSFRNEISPRQGLVRLREFSQAEVQFFTNPKAKNDHPRFDEVKKMRMLVWTKQHQERGKRPETMTIGKLVKGRSTVKPIAYYLARSVELFMQMGIGPKRLRLRQHRDDERSFYSNDTWDVEFLSEAFGRIELVGIADRTDYDLSRHQELSGKDMSVNMDGDKFIPHVIEIAYGIDRPVLCAIESCLKESGDRTYFTFPPTVAPYQVAVFPLVRRDGLPGKAMLVYRSLIDEGFFALYDEAGSIGRLYYRQDEAGTPAAITVDYDTLKDDSVTLRDRDTQKQIRVKMTELVPVLKRFLSGEKLVNLGKPIN